MPTIVDARKQAEQQISEILTSYQIDLLIYTAYQNPVI